MVISLIGKSGAGKSTIAACMAHMLRKSHDNILVIDGDELRNAIAPDLGFTYAEREKSEERRSRLMKVISDQGIHIICAALSNYPEWRAWCRKNIKDYYEVYLKVAQTELENRDAKGIYGRFRKGEISNVVGLDIEFIVPASPHLVIENNGALDPDSIAKEIVKNLPKL